MKERQPTHRLISLSLVLALACSVLPPARAQGAKQPLYAADGEWTFPPGALTTA